MLDEPDQRAVIRGLRDGRREAWAALYDGYSADVWRYVARLVGESKDDVADVVQETFLAAARSARQFDPTRGTLWGWLAGIAHHHACLYWRRIGQMARLRALAEARTLEVRAWSNGSDAPDHVWMKRELADLVRGVLAELSAEYAMLLTAKYLDDRSLDDLSHQLGSSVEAAKSKLARARREFRAKFEAMAHHSEGSPGIAISGSLERLNSKTQG